MKKIKATFILIAIVGICSAFISNAKPLRKKPGNKILCKKYVGLSSFGGKTYLQNSPFIPSQPYQIPISWQAGDEYDCFADNAVCTVVVSDILQPLYDHSAGLYYFWDINIVHCANGYFFNYEE